MKILAYSGLWPYWGSYEPDVLERDGGMVGGGEAHFLNVSTGLAALGHDVLALHPGQPGKWRDVEFRYRAEYDRAVMLDRWDAVLSWSDPRVLWHPAVKSAARILVQQLNELSGVTEDVDAVAAASLSHAEYLKKTFLAGQKTTPKFYEINSGVTCSYPAASRWPRDPIVGYWSSPDRGLLHLLRVWPAVKAAVPQARLWVFYEIKRWLDLIDGTYGHMTPFHGWLRYQGEQVRRLLVEVAPLGLEVFGGVNRKELARRQQQCAIWCYPLDNGADYVEGMCVAMLEALAAGCWPITSPVDALPSVYGAAHADWITRGDEAALKETLIKRLLNMPDQPEANFVVADRYTWSAAARQAEAVINDVVTNKRKTGAAAA